MLVFIFEIHYKRQLNVLQLQSENEKYNSI